MNKEKIVIVGYGWVGQANALSLAQMGYQVFYYDVTPPVYRYAGKYSELYKKVKTRPAPPQQAELVDKFYLVVYKPNSVPRQKGKATVIYLAPRLLSGSSGTPRQKRSSTLHSSKDLAVSPPVLQRGSSW